MTISAQMRSRLAGAAADALATIRKAEASAEATNLHAAFVMVEPGDLAALEAAADPKATLPDPVQTARTIREAQDHAEATISLLRGFRRSRIGQEALA